MPLRPANLDHGRAKASALAVDAGGGGLDIFFSHLSFLFFLLSLGDDPYRLKYCLKGLLNIQKKLVGLF